MLHRTEGVRAEGGRRAFATPRPKAGLLAVCRALLADHPELGGDDGVLRQVSLLPDITVPQA
ncbi:hypothetical protein [Streptomyces caatingaensis]|uniref:Uncharacterized protein n=1 Tax=Streptomyces caatingaensis TaxID=1678637 RepID=A0A0K9XDW8_9ACTN|nr:hypothetical protein [Streptomyces caatingaensis]KNB51276.1 hypothetical protein AC230_17015 [Streptomyces caatingaensis]